MIFKSFKRKNSDAEKAVVNKLTQLMREDSDELSVVYDHEDFEYLLHEVPTIHYGKIVIVPEHNGLAGITAPRIRRYNARIEFEEKAFTPDNKKEFNRLVDEFIERRADNRMMDSLNG